MADVDTAVLAAAPDTTTILAAYLNAAMDRDASARARYAALYGAQWSPLGHGARINDGATASAATVR